MNDLVHAQLRWRQGWTAALLLLGATIAQLLILRADPIEFSPNRSLYEFPIWLFAAAILCPLVRILHAPGIILTANGIGWCMGLAVLGLESVGALPIWPLLLAALAVTFWPRESDLPWPVMAIMIAVLGGILVCVMMWQNLQFLPG